MTAVTSLSTTGSNVFRSRVYPLGTNKLPALCVYADSEVVEYNRLDRVRDVDRTGFGLTAPNIPESVQNSLLNIVMVGVGGYVVGRSGEKIADKFKGPN